MKRLKKAKKSTKPNALRRAKLALAAAKRAIEVSGYSIQRHEHAAQSAATTIAAKDRELASAAETISQRNAAIALRDARLGEITGERDRILRLVDQFTSVQIITHGTELRIGANGSAPAALRSGVKDVVIKADAVVAVAAKEETRRNEVAQAYRSSIFRGIAQKPKLASFARASLEDEVFLK